VKHAFSLLKTNCVGASVHANHVTSAARQLKSRPQSGSSPRTNRSLPTPFSAPPSTNFLWAEPSVMLSRALSSLRERRDMRAAVARYFGRADAELHYETLQAEPERQVRGLLAAVGAGPLDAPALRRSALVKSSPEDLRNVLLNFDEIRDSFRPWECLLKMLRSSTPQHFGLGSCRFPPDQHYQPYTAPPPGRVLRCAFPLPRGPLGGNGTDSVLDTATRQSVTRARCVVKRGKRRGGEHDLSECTAAETSLCESASSKAQSMHGAPAAEVCVVGTPSALNNRR